MTKYIIEDIEKLIERAYAVSNMRRSLHDNNEGRKVISIIKDLIKDVDELKQLNTLKETAYKGQVRAFLKDFVFLPLNDAKDALDFDPPHLCATKQRINMVINSIQRKYFEK